MRSLRVIAICVVVAIGAFPADARTSGTPRPDRWTGPKRSGLQVLAEARGRRMDATALQRFQREIIAADSVAALADPEFVFPSRAGDLDGDGKQDVLTFEFAGNDASMSARSGLTGAPLWEVAGAYVGVPVDADADGIGDVLTLSTMREVLAPGVSTNMQRITLARGDGTAAWTYDVPGTIARISTGDYSGVFTDTEFVVALRSIPDATGDGLADVWVATSTFVQVATDQFIVDADVMTGRALDGATGLEVGRIATTGLDGFPWIVPAADLSGDGLADAFAFQVLASGAGVLSARSLHGVPHWSVEVPTHIAYPFVHEMTADGAPDLMLQDVGGASLRRGYSGADGRALWSRPDTGTIDRAGDIDGDGAQDMIQMEAPGSSIVATAWSGATGLDLWGPATYAGPDGAFTAYCFCTDDLTGDGIWDPLTAEIVFSDPPMMTVRALNGTSGTLMWVASRPASDGFPSPIGADADGDGATDLAVAPSTGSAVTVRTLRGRDFSPIWSTTAPLEGFPIGFYGDDLAGDGSPEIVLASIRFVDESIRGAAHAVDPAGMLWSSP